MSSVLDKQTAIVELFKAGNSRQDLSKSIKVNRMLVWRTLKRYEETGDIQNRPGQGRPRTARTPKLVKSTTEKIRRNPKRFIQNLLGFLLIFTVDMVSNVKCVVWNHVNCSPKGPEDVPSQVCQKTPTFGSSCWLTTSKMQDSSFPHWRWHVAKPRFHWWEEIEYHFNTQNDRIWSRNVDEGSPFLDWAAVIQSGRSLLFFYWSRGEIELAELSS